MKKMNKKGFTLVELVVVIAVIAILAGVLIGTFTSVINRANQSKAVQELKAKVDEAYVEYMAEYHIVPAILMLKDGLPTFGGTYTVPDDGAEVFILKANTYVAIDTEYEVYFNWTGSEYNVATTKEPTAATMVPADVYTLMVTDYTHLGKNWTNVISISSNQYYISNSYTGNGTSAIVTTDYTKSGNTYTLASEGTQDPDTIYYTLSALNGIYGDNAWSITDNSVDYSLPVD